MEAYAVRDIFFFPRAVENEEIAVQEPAARGTPLRRRKAECFAGRFEPASTALMAETREEFAASLQRHAPNEALSMRGSRRRAQSCARTRWTSWAGDCGISTAA